MRTRLIPRRSPKVLSWSTKATTGTLGLNLPTLSCPELHTLRKELCGSTRREERKWAESLFLHLPQAEMTGRSSGELDSGSILVVAHTRSRALSEVLGYPVPIDDQDDMFYRANEISPTLLRLGERELVSNEMMKLGLKQLAKASAAEASSTPMKKPIEDFYRTDPISRASVTMAACSKAFTKKEYEISDGEDAATAQASYA